MHRIIAKGYISQLLSVYQSISIGGFSDLGTEDCDVHVSHGWSIASIQLENPINTICYVDMNRGPRHGGPISQAILAGQGHLFDKAHEAGLYIRCTKRRPVDIQSQADVTNDRFHEDLSRLKLPELTINSQLVCFFLCFS